MLEISLQGVAEGKPFIMEKLSMEGLEIITAAKEKYPKAQEGVGEEGRYILNRVIFATLLSSNSLMGKLGYSKDCSEYRLQLEQIARRMKADEIEKFMEAFSAENKDFLTAMAKKANKAQTPITTQNPASSSPQPQDTPLSTPPA